MKPFAEHETHGARELEAAPGARVAGGRQPSAPRRARRLFVAVLIAVPFAAGVSSAQTPRPQPTSTASSASASWPASWPPQPLKPDYSVTGQGETQPAQGTFKSKLAFLDATGKSHQIVMTSGGTLPGGDGSLEIQELRLDGQPLNTVPQYRALLQYLRAAHLSLGMMNSDRALECIRPDDDDAANGSCTGMHNRPSYPATAWTKGSPTARTVTPNLDYSKPESWPTGKFVDDPYNTSGMKSWDDGHVTLEDYVIEQANGRRHHISMDYAFLTGKINKLTFNGHVLNTVPQYRALYKWVMQYHKWTDYRAETTLECTRANEDNALTTNPDCKSWVGPW